MEVACSGGSVCPVLRWSWPGCGRLGSAYGKLGVEGEEREEERLAQYQRWIPVGGDSALACLWQRHPARVDQSSPSTLLAWLGAGMAS